MTTKTKPRPTSSKSKPARAPRRSRPKKYPSIGPWVISWMEANLVHADGEIRGEPFRPDPWFKDTINRAYRFDPDNDFRRLIRRVLIMIGSGNAKTEYCAAWALAELAGPVVAHAGVMDGQPPRLRHSPIIPIGAASYDQTGLLFGAAKIMAEEGPLEPFVDSFEKELRLKNRAGRIYRLAAVAGTSDGAIPSAFFADEYHEWVGKKRRVHTVLGNKLRKRASLGDVFEVTLSTAGDPAQSEGLRTLYDHARRVIAGEVSDPEFLPIIYEPADTKILKTIGELDKGSAAERKAKLAAVVQATADANPAAWMDPEVIVKRLTVDKIPVHEYARYHLNLWVYTGETWEVADVWHLVPTEPRGAPNAPGVAGADELEPIDPGTKIVLTFDGSYNNDSTSLYACTLDGHLFPLGLWERPENAKTWKVPRGEVDAAVAGAMETYDVLELSMDPAKWSTEFDAWVDRYGEDRVLEYPQTHVRMVPATKKFRDAVFATIPLDDDEDDAEAENPYRLVPWSLTHSGDPALGRHIGNANVKAVGARAYVLTKTHPNQKIDAAITAVMALDRATIRRELEPPEREPRITLI